MKLIVFPTLHLCKTCAFNMLLSHLCLLKSCLYFEIWFEWLPMKNCLFYSVGINHVFLFFPPTVEHRWYLLSHLHILLYYFFPLLLFFCTRLENAVGEKKKNLPVHCDVPYIVFIVVVCLFVWSPYAHREAEICWKQNCQGGVCGLYKGARGNKRRKSHQKSKPASHRHLSLGTGSWFRINSVLDLKYPLWLSHLFPLHSHISQIEKT